MEVVPLTENKEHADRGTVTYVWNEQYLSPSSEIIFREAGKSSILRPTSYTVGKFSENSCVRAFSLSFVSSISDFSWIDIKSLLERIVVMLAVRQGGWCPRGDPAKLWVAQKLHMYYVDDALCTAAAHILLTLMHCCRTTHDTVVSQCMKFHLSAMSASEMLCKCRNQNTRNRRLT